MSASPVDKSDRYAKAFVAAADRQGHVLVPFFVIGDPDPQRFLAIVDAVVEAGVDALELGIPFSDPVADGPAIQDAITRARSAGVDKHSALEFVAAVRRRHPQVPIGLLVYANLVYTPAIDTFYKQAAAAGVDSVLVADVPVQHVETFHAAGDAHGVHTVLIAPPNASDTDLARIAELSSGYVYLVSRAGVTGADTAAGEPVGSVIERLRDAGAPPTLLGFGISKPEHVRAAVDAGAAGVISGSAFSTIIATHLDDQEALLDEVRALVRLLS